MTKTIDTLVEDIKAVLRGENPGELNQADKTAVIAHWEGIIGKGWLDRHLEERQGHRVRMSNFGKVCTRELWYHHNSKGRKVQKLNPELLHLFSYGHLVEAQVLMLAELAGHSVELCQEEAVLTDFIKGSTDAVIDGVVCDVKSTSDYNFTKFTEGLKSEDDMFGYLGQLNGYYAALKDKPEVTDHDRVAFFAVNKTSGEMCLDFHKPTKPELMVEYANNLEEKVKAEEPPARIPPIEKGSNKGLATPCQYCNFKFECWPEVRAFSYKKGTTTKNEFLVEVNKEPRVDEVPTDDMWEVAE